MSVKRIFLLPVLFLSILLSGCEKAEECSCKDQDGESEYLIFGHYYGECMGDECVQIYKLTSSTLYRDTLHQYPGNGAYEFQEMAQNKFAVADGLIDLIPDSLLAVSDTTFGCPDCADQGGLIITYSAQGSVNTWHIDKDLNAVPEYLHGFLESVNDRMELISD